MLRLYKRKDETRLPIYNKSLTIDLIRDLLKSLNDEHYKVTIYTKDGDKIELTKSPEFKQKKRDIYG